MAFGPIMQFTVGELHIELAPLTKEVMPEFINRAHGGGLQRNSVHRYLGMGIAPVEEDELAWFERTREDKNSLVWGIWLVEPAPPNQTPGDPAKQAEAPRRTLIGNSALTSIGKDGHSGFIRQATTGSLIFRSDYWGKGIASAAHQARTWYAFQHLGIHRIKSAVIQANGGSRTALERSGYTLVYTERNEMYGGAQLQHLDCLECLNPLPLFWDQWWHGDRPPLVARQARQRTARALDWARQNVELL